MQKGHRHSGGRKTVNPPHGCNHTEDCFLHIIQTYWRRTVCQNRLIAASPQGIAALAAQGGAATLTEGRDAAIPGQAVFFC